nr:outer membrane beta-barrel protein [Polymorphobacter sp.]
MFKSVFAAAVAFVAVPAFAQGTPENFNGPFIGAQAGWQQDRQTLQVGNTEASAKSDGFAYGGQVGYDFRLSPSTVLGAEVSLTGRSGDAAFDDFDLSTGRTINATARLGYVIDPQGLIYVRGGYSNARFTIDDGVDRISENRDGYTLGAGYERMLATNVSARLEYNYSNFGSDDLSAVVGPNAELDYSRHAVTAGVNFRF